MHTPTPDMTKHTFLAFPSQGKDVSLKCISVLSIFLLLFLFQTKIYLGLNMLLSQTKHTVNMSSPKCITFSPGTAV